MKLTINNLNYKYHNSDDYILKNLNLEVDENEIIALIGASGIGKTTLLRIIAGLEVAQSGEIKIDDKVVFNSKVNIAPGVRKVGILFQDYSLFPHMTVKQNIEYALKKNSPFTVHELLEIVSMENYESSYPHQLSGGQQQRVAISRVLASEPDILLLDEPFSNFDAQLQKQVRGYLKEILNRFKITTILVTHNMEDAKVMADRIIYLKSLQADN